MREPFKERVALVTGGGGAMGRAEAMLFANGGAHVVVQDIEEDSCQETVRLLHDAGGRAEPLVLDAADVGAFRAAIVGLENTLGGVDILVNNHGIGGDDLYLEQIDEANYDRMFAVNTKAVFFASQAVAASMKRKRWGRIINISSMVASVGWATNSQYSGAKAALLGFARSWALELAPFGITVNTVIPSITVPGMATNAWTKEQRDDFLQQNPIPTSRFATPEDVANCVAFFASAEAEQVTGQTISPNGGGYVSAM